MVFIWEIIYQRKNGAYVINFDDFKSIGTHWIALYVNSENVTYFDGFVVERITKEVFLLFTVSVVTNMKKYEIQAYDSIICGYFCVGFIKFLS